MAVNEDAIRKLQLLLGKAIDIAETGYGGSTRQVPTRMIERDLCPYRPALAIGINNRSLNYWCWRLLDLSPQITVDEKGLAAIFVFGLPGFGQYNHALMCLQSSLAILDVMETGGMETHAGLATGACFCGLVGDPMQRCEYAVLGGEN